MNLVEAQQNPVAEYKLSPEALQISETYLSCLDITATAKNLDITVEEVTLFLNKKEVKRFLDQIFLSQGYMNRHKLSGILDKVIDSKLEEAEETGIYTNKDLLDVLTLISKIRQDELKILQANDKIGTQTNIQVNDASASSNLGKLIES